MSILAAPLALSYPDAPRSCPLSRSAGGLAPPRSLVARLLPKLPAPTWHHADRSSREARRPCGAKHAGDSYHGQGSRGPREWARVCKTALVMRERGCLFAHAWWRAELCEDRPLRRPS
eukprot:scaffold593_cov382-Prasinococcus_capsulatus_cf.AAC.22